MSTPSRAWEEEPETVAKRESRIAMEVSLPQFLLGFKCRPVWEGENYFRSLIVGELACDLLLGESSPLYQRLYSQGLINASFGGSYEMLPGAAYFSAGGDSKDPRAVSAAVCQEARRLVREGVDPDFYQQIRRAAFGASLRGLDSFENIAVTMTEGCFNSYDPLRFPETFDSIGPDDLLAFLRENITEERSVLSEIVPKEG